MVDGPAPTKKRVPLPVRILMPLGIAFGLLIVAGTISANRPTNVARLSVQYAPIEDRSGQNLPVPHAD